MSNIVDMFFFLQFFGYMGIFLALFYNLLRLGELWDKTTSVLLFVIYVILYGIGFSTFIISSTRISDYSGTIYSFLFGFESLFFVIGGIFFIVLMLFGYTINTKERSTEAYMPGLR
jgi:hypothetical protein